MKIRDKFAIGIFIAALILAACFMVSDARADLVYPTTDLTFKARTIYNDGNLAQPDSLLIMVTKAGAHLTSGWYNTGDAECAADSAGLVFHDQLQDFDGAGGIGHYLIEVGAYDKDSGLYTWYYHYYTVGIIDTTTADTVNAILDTLQLYDGRLALAATQTLIVDTVNGIMDTLQNYPARVDLVWDEPLTGGTHNVATSSGRRLRAIQGPASTGTAQVSGTPTSPERYIILASAESEGDNFYNDYKIYIESGTGIGQTRIIADYTGATDSVALHVGDDWITNPDNTSVYEIDPWSAIEVVHMHDAAIDGIWEYDTANISGAQATGTVLKMLDSTGVYDTRFDSLLAAAEDAKLEKVWFNIDTTNIDTSEIGEWFTTGISASLSDANMGAIADSVWDKIYADAIAQAGGAGDSLWAILNDLLDSIQNHDNWVAKEASLGDGSVIISDLNTDGDTIAIVGTGTTMRLKSLIVTNQSGDAVVFTGGKAPADPIAGEGLTLVSLYNGDGLECTGAGTGKDIDADIFGTMTAVTTVQKVEDTVNALLDTLQLWDTRIDSLEAALADANLAKKVWDRLIATHTTPNTFGDSLMQVIEDDGVKVATNAIGSGAIAAAAIGASEIATNAIGALEIATDAIGVAEIAAAVYEEVWRNIDTTNVDTSEIGEWLSTGVSASISDANMGAIGDTVWDKAYADMIAQAGGAGDSLQAILNDLLDSLQNHDNWVATEVTAAKALDSLADVLDSLEAQSVWIQDTLYALLDTLQLWDTRIDSLEAALADANIGDKVWDTDTTGHLDAGYYGLEATTGSAASISAAAIVAIADTVWNRNAGDHTTAHTFGDSIMQVIEDDGILVATGAITAAAIAMAAIDADAIAANAIGASEIASNAIGASEIATDAIGVAELAAAVFEELWRNIDTTNVDTSDIGVWLVSAISTGGGPQACTVLVDDGTNPIVNAGFRVYNADRSTQIGTAKTTDANGKGFPWLTVGIDYDVIAYATGYSSTLTNNWDPDTATLTTISLTAFSIDAPPNAQTCQVNGHVRNAAGDTARYCPITFTLGCIARNLCDSTIIGGEKGEAALVISTATDGNGDFQVSLVESHCWDCNDDGVADTDTVMYKMHIGGIDQDYEFVVPDAATFQIIRE